MITYSEMERLASAGGYETRGRDICRITVGSVHRVYVGLAGCPPEGVQPAITATARLRRWLMHSDGTPPPVSGADFVHSNKGSLERPSIAHLSGLVAVAPVDEFDDEDQRYG